MDNNSDMVQLIQRHREDSSTRFSTPTKRRRINSLQAQYIRLLLVTQQHSLQILDSGAGISGVGQQWKITDIEQASEVTIQGAFGEPIHWSTPCAHEVCKFRSRISQLSSLAGT